jgi:tRNA 2-thiouridine synthesizing protein C
MKKILFISRHSPYGTSQAREALEALLAAAVYGQDTQVLFMDDGVFQLVNNQNSATIDQKSLGASLPALPLYDVEKIYVHSESLRNRGISANELVLDSVQIIDSQAVSRLLAQQDQLLSF